jgi:imidazolonepropionase
MNLILTNIGTLVLADRSGKTMYRGADMAQLPLLKDAWLHIENGRIADFGLMAAGVPAAAATTELWNIDGRLVWPAWCDSHSHAVYAAPRQDEFAMRLRGATYADIAAAGGGILNSARRLAAM